MQLPPFYYDPDGYYAYVMLKGDEEFLQKVLAVLKKNGVDCPRYGKSMRRASNGIQYDWFIRVFIANRQFPTREQIDRIFEEKFGFLSIERQIEKQQQAVDEYGKRLEELQSQLEEAAVSDDLLKIADNELSEYKRVNQRLALENRNLREQTETLKMQVENLEQIILALQEQNAEMQKFISTERKDSTEVETIEMIVATLLPDIMFADNSLEYLLSESPDAEWILRTLESLHNNREVKSKRVETSLFAWSSALWTS